MLIRRVRNPVSSCTPVGKSGSTQAIIKHIIKNCDVLWRRIVGIMRESHLDWESVREDLFDKVIFKLKSER